MGKAVALVLATATLLLVGCDVQVPTFDQAAAGEPLAEYLTDHGRMVQVERVVDGDTIAVTGDERVRLLTIDAPELRANTKADDADCGAVEARDALAELLPVGTPVALNGLKGEPAQDRYGRSLSNVYVESGGQLVNVSLWLVEQGHAREYTSYSTSDSDTARELQQQAQDASRGMWATC